LLLSSLASSECHNVDVQCIELVGEIRYRFVIAHIISRCFKIEGSQSVRTSSNEVLDTSLGKAGEQGLITYEAF